MEAWDLSDDEDAVAEIVRSVRTVAVYGMRDESKRFAPGYRIPQMMRSMGVRVIPVNPNIRSSQGLRAVPDLASVGEPVDVVQVFRRSDAVGDVADQILALPGQRPPVVWMQSGIVNHDAARRLGAAGVRVVMDRCMSVDMVRYRPQ